MYADFGWVAVVKRSPENRTDPNSPSENKNDPNSPRAASLANTVDLSSIRR
jgi:hypothetical protein